eukprot:3964769-Karenia_brevis.AAC.1
MAKKPYWGCRCGCRDNWATTVACHKCGAQAPRKVLNAVAASKVRPVESQPKAATGKWASSNGTTQLKKELESAKKEQARLRESLAQANGQQAPSNSSESVMVSIEDMEKRISSLKEWGLQEAADKLQRE